MASVATLGSRHLIRVTLPLALSVLVAVVVSGCFDAAIPTPPVSSGDPAWSPDGEWIAYTFHRTPWGEADVYVMRANGGDKRQLTSDYGSSSPTWSPDGKRIAFSSCCTDIFVMQADGSHPRNLTGGRLGIDGVPDDPAWSPSGGLIAFTSSDGVYVMQVDGTKLRRIAPASDYPFGPVWSPDNSQIAYYAAAYDDHGGIVREDVHVVDSNGRDDRVLIRDAYSPTWSPDGKTIAFLRRLAVPSETGDVPRFSASIGTISPDGSQLRIVGEDIGPTDSISWSPDGIRLARAGGGSLTVMDADGPEWHRR